VSQESVLPDLTSKPQSSTTAFIQSFHFDISIIYPSTSCTAAIFPCIIWPCNLNALLLAAFAILYAGTTRELLEEFSRNLTSENLEKKFGTVSIFRKSLPIDTVTDLNNALSGNGSANTVQHATTDEDVFSMWSAPRNNTVEVFYMWSEPNNNTEAVFSVHCPCREDIRFSVIRESS
jgi:hypothetical protein